MSFIPIVNVNEKDMNKEQVLALLMDTYDKLMQSEGPDYYEITLRLSAWAGKITEQTGE